MSEIEMENKETLSRRELLKHASALTLVMALSAEEALAEPAPTPAGPPVCVGVVGLGLQGRELLASLVRLPGASPPRPGATLRASRSATRRALAWRAAGAWSAVGRGAWSRRGGSGSAARRSRRPAWHAGMAHGGGGSHPGGAAPGVCPGAARATGAGAGFW